MTSNIRNFLDRTKTFVTSSLPGTPRECATPKKPTKDTLFPVVDPQVDGEECLHDCASCPIEYPRSFQKIGIDEDDELWGRVNEYGVHAIVATGKTDWLRDVEDEDGSVMKALAKVSKGTGSKSVMISASNMPPPHEYYEAEEQKKPKPTTVLILPSFTMVEQVTPGDASELLNRFIYTGPTSRTPLTASELKPQESPSPTTSIETPPSNPSPDPQDPTVTTALHNAVASLTISPDTSIPQPLPTDRLTISRPCPHDYIVLLCSHKRRDARCGISAPLLAKEFERHLRPLGLHRDLNDLRPGGVGLYFINHVGGHRYSANVLLYRKQDGMGVWLARVAPKHVEGIVKYTILQGKIVHPAMIRGGFYRKTGDVSW